MGKPIPGSKEMADKVERWKATEDGFDILDKHGTGIIADFYPYREKTTRPRMWEAKRNRDLAVALHNAALDVSPSPMAVAEGLEQLTKDAEDMLEWFKAKGFDREQPEYRNLEVTLADITKPATKERDV